jgi:DNA (cytosine-5)-methyltransferase 1
MSDCTPTRLRAVDLYAGAGGLSLGLSLAGIDVVAAVEHDAWAAETYAYNHPKTELFCANVDGTKTILTERFKGVDLVVGGPPSPAPDSRRCRLVTLY